MDRREQWQDKTKELTLLLLYMNSWIEKESWGSYRRAWKGYDFDDLNKLEEEECITGSHKAKSVYFTKEGERRARELLLRYAPELAEADRG